MNLNNKGRTAIIVVIVAFLAVLVFALTFDKESNTSKKPESGDDTTKVTTTGDEQAETTTMVEEATSHEENKTEVTNKTEEVSTNSEETTTETAPIKKPKKDTSKQEDTPSYISVPFTVPGTDIVISYINGYTGLYLENGKDKDIKNVMAIQVDNLSDQPIEYGQITLEAKNKLYEFDFSCIPAGDSVIAMEKNKQKHKSNTKYTYVTSSFAYLNELDVMEDEIEIEVLENNGIKVTNLTKKKIPTVRIFYKYQMDSGEYVGGITYTAKIENLEPQTPVSVYPSHFDSEGSRVMMVRTYDN